MCGRLSSAARAKIPNFNYVQPFVDLMVVCKGHLVPRNRKIVISCHNMNVRRRKSLLKLTLGFDGEDVEPLIPPRSELRIDGEKSLKKFPF